MDARRRRVACVVMVVTTALCAPLLVVGSLGLMGFVATGGVGGLYVSFLGVLNVSCLLGLVIGCFRYVTQRDFRLFAGASVLFVVAQSLQLMGQVNTVVAVLSTGLITANVLAYSATET